MAPLQSASSRHATHVPIVVQNLSAALPPKPGHSASVSHVAAQSPELGQNGAPASQSAELVQSSATHVLPRQIRPPVHMLPSGKPLVAQSAASVQQASGLV
jgi:hypothetical protein